MSAPCSSSARGVPAARRRRRVLWGILLLVFVTVGCSTGGYYWQAVNGHLAIVSRERPIARVLEDPATPAPLKSKLELVLQMREFARQHLALPVDGHYRDYADLGRRYVVWNVHAAPEFSLEARTWWYPFVGRLKYRGYYSEAGARRLADALEQRGEDVYVGGVEAYSTLGWFRDPVLNTWIDNPPVDIAETLFHELTHQRVFLSGDTDFNEAFATATSQEGVRRWLRERGGPGDLDQYEQWLRREASFVAQVQETRRRLEALYTRAAGAGTTGGPPLLIGELRAAKARMLEDLQQAHRALRERWGGRSPYEKWFARPLNNARLNTVATYFDLVPGFQRLLERQGGDLPRYYEAVRRMSRLSREERRKLLLAKDG